MNRGSRARIRTRHGLGLGLHLKKILSSYRSEIADLKRRLQALEKQASRGPKPAPKVAAVSQDSETKHRFSAKGLATHRQRLGLSAADYGALLEVSALTVYKWEGGQAR